MILLKKLTFGILFIILMMNLQSCASKLEKELSFLTFNIWQEGTSVPNGLEKIKEIVLATDPDVVCFIEVRNYKELDWTTKIVNLLAENGKVYHRGYIGGDVAFISKYPLTNGRQLFANTDKGTVVSFELNLKGNTIILSGMHLDYTYYASNLPRGYYGSDPNWKMIDNGSGKPRPITDVDSIQAYNLKSARDEAIESFVEAMDSVSVPVVVMGDFNEPSFLDWTDRTKNMFDHHGVVLPWYNTKVLHKAAYIDVFRTYYPDELINPGFTWPSFVHEKESTSWTPLADDRDRIDYIFIRGDGVTIKDVHLVGPKDSYINSKLDTLDASRERFKANKLAWPSDHKALLARLSFLLNSNN